MRMKNHPGGFHAAGFLPAIVACLLPFSSGVGAVPENPAPGAAVSTRSPQKRRSLSTDMAEALGIFQDKKQRAELRAFPAEFTVVCVNCGSFHYGNKTTPKAVYRGNWKQMVKNADADVFFFEDFGRKFATGKAPAAKLDICHLAKLPPDEVAVLPLVRDINGRKTPRYRALRLCWSVNGKRIAFYGVHLVAEGHIPGKTRDANGRTPSQQLRRRQFAELIEDAKKYDHAVLCGDFNAQKPEEYDIFTKHGFTLANCSERFGTHASLRNIPADNIIVSPGLEIVDFRLLREPELDTDHIPLKAVVRFKE